MRDPVVIDGSCVLHNGQRIRIWGIDTPEASQAEGLSAKDHLVQLCQRRHIHVVPRGKDANGQMVAYLFCGRGDIGAAMVAGGYAVSANGAYVRLEMSSRRNRMGLWRDGWIENPTIHRLAKKKRLT
ncbi:thermonuclease family protein [Epibacterium sp. DP7N7-1]|nr:thermonuclease family protein [Epibacterium sp. DP7N7-1]